MKKKGAKKVKITSGLESVLREQHRKFVKKYGQDPGPIDLVFFDAPSPQEFDKLIIEAMGKADIAPELIYAYKKTGRILTEEAMINLSKEEIKEWQDDINEYFENKKRAN